MHVQLHSVHQLVLVCLFTGSAATCSHPTPSVYAVSCMHMSCTWCQHLTGCCQLRVAKFAVVTYMHTVQMASMHRFSTRQHVHSVVHTIQKPTDTYSESAT